MAKKVTRTEMKKDDFLKELLEYITNRKPALVITTNMFLADLAKQINEKFSIESREDEVLDGINSLLRAGSIKLGQTKDGYVTIEKG